MPITTGHTAMETNIFKLLKNSKIGQIGRFYSTLAKVSIEQLLGDFTPKGGKSALFALFVFGYSRSRQHHD